MIFQNLRMALSSIGRNKLRSCLTMLGMIIGIAAVVTVLSIGDGLKAQVQKEVDSLGVDLITIAPQPEGKPLTMKDFELVQKSGVVSNAAPATYLGVSSTNGAKKSDTAIVAATTPAFNDILSQKVQKGRFFDDKDKDVAVIGASVATDLFGTEDPIGKKIVLKDQVEDPATLETKTIEKAFTVIGVYNKLSSENSIGPGAQLDMTIYIPFESGKFFTKNATYVDEISARATSTDQLGQTKTTLTDIIKKNRKNTEDFTISTSEDVSQSFNDIFGIITSFIAAIAAISLLVGGIGIMNIMLTSVTERTREIGIRKSIGASRTIILLQFMTEALVLTILGGLLGIVVAYGLSFAVKSFADITPVFTPSSFLVAIGVSVLIGVVFGTFPAITAARKKPIDALRHE
jgi:putative ABC transport system permease protein